MKKVTTKDLMDFVCKNIKDEGNMPDILDYAILSGNEFQIKDTRFEIKADLNYGSNEGIYLRIYLDGYFCETGESKISNISTFKTLRTDDEAMHIMANLMAECLIKANIFYANNLDAMEWYGTNIYSYREDETPSGALTYYGTDEENIILRVNRMFSRLGDVTRVVIRDNATKKEKTITREKWERKGE